LVAQVADESLICRMSGDYGTWRMVVDTNEAASLLSVISAVPLRVPLEQRVAFAQEVARLNAGRRFGCWQLSLDDGLLLHCVSVPTAGLRENLEAIMDEVFGLAVTEAGTIMKRLAEAAFAGVGIAPAQSAGTTPINAESRIQFN
jgi:hypothetical protein